VSQLLTALDIVKKSQQSATLLVHSFLKKVSKKTNF